MRLLMVLLICAAAFATFKFIKTPKLRMAFTEPKSSTLKAKIPSEAGIRLKEHVTSLKPFLDRNDYAQDFCFLIDMKIPSGKPRFFIFNLKKNVVVDSGLVTHGDGSETSSDKLQFSNVANSHATSIGKYKVGQEYYGSFGMAFKLFGLNVSNSNAFERFVVLHGHNCVPLQNVYPQQICTSFGCPTVNPIFLNTLKKYIDGATKPIILWIYY